MRQLPADRLAPDVAPPAPVVSRRPTGVWIGAVAAIAVIAIVSGAVLYIAVDPPPQQPQPQPQPLPLPLLQRQPEPPREPQPEPRPEPAAVEVPVPVPDAPRRAPPTAALARGERKKEPPESVVTPAAKRDMTLGATPWAYVTVDGDPTKHETPVTLPLCRSPSGRTRSRSRTRSSA
jgi:outer membrane biosynthesis protein TonB